MLDAYTAELKEGEKVGLDPDTVQETVKEFLK